jgi:hypothetical protein
VQRLSKSLPEAIRRMAVQRLLSWTRAACDVSALFPHERMVDGWPLGWAYMSWPVSISLVEACRCGQPRAVAAPGNCELIALDCANLAIARTTRREPSRRRRAVRLSPLGVPEPAHPRMQVFKLWH